MKFPEWVLLIVRSGVEERVISVMMPVAQLEPVELVAFTLTVCENETKLGAV